MTDIVYTGGITFFKKNEVLFTIVPPNSVVGKIIKTEYEIMSFSDLFKHIESVVKEMKFNLKAGFVEMRYKCEAGTKIVFSKKLQHLFGFDDEEVKFKETGFSMYSLKAGKPSYLAFGNTKMYIYCNLVQPQFINHSMSQCIKTCTYLAKTKQTVTHEFANPMFLNLAVSEFNSIQIYIRNESGDPFPFVFGSLTLILRFRKKS